ncbi:SDR family NAD(P)-dependent oxidoreductase [Halococcus sediminicola]|uniref:SDR family NAD(P)-dependent oxidoreductase n=1 Tax=Halococcus sediminicola TaxID=1264579 RepID=UPI0006787599|nr:glucose 1-dehydrogenase [Halococcus sediminicola]
MSSNANDLEGQVALITGGGGDIGTGIATELAQHGADIAVADVDSLESEHNQAGSSDIGGYESSQSVIDKIEEIGQNVISVECDVTDSEQTQQMAETVVNEFGSIDILAANAGIITASSVEDMDEDEWDAVMDVNVKGQLLCAQAVIPQMKSQEDGAIINTASVAGKVPFRDLAHYCASKYASIGLTQTLALELAPDDITVNAICPGIVETPMWTDVLTPSRDEPYDETIQNLMPLGRDQTPKDMGELAVYFATSENVTGQAVNVDGGMTINVVR